MTVVTSKTLCVQRTPATVDNDGVDITVNWKYTAAVTAVVQKT